MDDLKSIYRQALPGRIEALETARAAADRGEAAATIRRIAHALRGSGGTYGFPGISAAAAAVEDAPADELFTSLDHLIALLRSIAADDARVTRILIVEDEPEHALLMRTILEKPGRTVDVARTRAEARQMVAGGVSLVLLDLLLPDADGRSVLLELRERPETAETPVVIISARSDAHAKTECFALGASGFLEKPIEPELLAAVVGAQLRTAPRVAPARPSVTGEPCIMVVEDDELVVSVLKHRLERDGFSICHYSDGISALDAVDRENISLAILDVKVPGIDGFDLLARLRARPATATTPIIMLTALGAERDVLRGFQLGASDYITKPFSPIEVLARVKRLLRT